MKSMNLPKMSTVKPFVHKPKVVWVCDFTYIRAAGRFYYLRVILDLFSRKVIAYKLSSKINTQLTINTINFAVFAV